MTTTMDETAAPSRQPAIDAAAVARDRAAAESLRFMRYSRTLLIEPDKTRSGTCYQVHDMRIPFDWAGIDPFRHNHIVWGWEEVYERCFDLLVFLQDTSPCLSSGKWQSRCLQFDRQSLNAEYWQAIGEALAGSPDFEAYCQDLPGFDVNLATKNEQASNNREALFSRFDEWLDVIVTTSAK